VSTVTDFQLKAWIDHVFDHPVAADIRNAWYWADDRPEWEGPLEDVPTLIAEMCERSGGGARALLR
jgi:hypothetical protein